MPAPQNVHTPRSGAAAVGFDPVAGVSATSAFLVRSDTGVSDTAGAVDTWADQSGNARNLTAAGTARPTTATRALNSVNVVDFDGSTDIMSTASFTQNLPYTYVLVAAADVTDADDQFLGGNTANQSAFRQNSSGTGVWRLAGNGVDLDRGSSNSSPHVFVVKWNTGATCELWVDGVQAGSTGTATPANLTGGMRVGATTVPASFLDGYIAVASVYDGMMSDGDRDYLESGWGAFWGITVA